LAGAALKDLLESPHDSPSPQFKHARRQQPSGAALSRGSAGAAMTEDYFAKHRDLTNLGGRESAVEKLVLYNIILHVMQKILQVISKILIVKSNLEVPLAVTCKNKCSYHIKYPL
jgi:hypothetical protein